MQRIACLLKTRGIVVEKLTEGHQELSISLKVHSMDSQDYFS